MKTTEKIIRFIKLQGAATVRALADETGLTTMAIRQHLQAMTEEGLLAWRDEKAPRGRPTRIWTLTAAGNTQFPDRHDELLLQMIDSTRNLFGDSGLERLIQDREEKSARLYSEILGKEKSLEGKLTALARVRSKEGYMAKIRQENDNLFYLVEHHCPICSAATHCQQFCRSELQLFRQLFKGVASVSREEYLLEGGSRCSYKIEASTK